MRSQKSHRFESAASRKCLIWHSSRARIAIHPSAAITLAHAGVIRTIARAVVGTDLERGVPKLGGLVQLTRDAGGRWFAGRRASFPDLTAG